MPKSPWMTLSSAASDGASELEDRHVVGDVDGDRALACESTLDPLAMRKSSPDAALSGTVRRTLPPVESMLPTRMAPLVSVSVMSPLVDADIWPVDDGRGVDVGEPRDVDDRRDELAVAPLLMKVRRTIVMLPPAVRLAKS